MSKLTSLIGADREFSGFIEAMKTAYRAPERLPIAVNGLSGGAEDAFLVEGTRYAFGITKAPVLIVVGTESERARLLSLLLDEGVAAVGYRAREFNFHTVGASHDIERERLSVLSEIISGKAEAVVTTPTALCQLTIPENLLLSLSKTLRIGDIIAPEELSSILFTLGYIRTETVEAVGQYSTRGGIVDLCPSEGIGCVRLEFFGDEIDRICTFDPITQRSLGALDSLSLSPAKEVLLSREAKSRLREHILALAKKTDGDARDRLTREAALLETDAPLSFTDKYIDIIYGEQTTLMSYLSPSERCVVFNLGTAECATELKTSLDSSDAELNKMREAGVIAKDCKGFYARPTEYEDFLSKALTVFVNPFAGGVGTKRLSALFGFRCRRTVSYGDAPTMLKDDLTTLSRALYRTVIVTDSEAGVKSLCESLTADGFAPIPVPDGNIEIKNASGG
jgi:transcription-repair coupling factor (superfamily II helicase)